MWRFLVVIGTRPCAVKLAPVVHALQIPTCGADVLLTGQHGLLLTCCMDSLGLEPKFVCRGPADGPLSARVARMVQDVSDVLNADSDSVDRYKAIVVVGDTASAMAGALAGFYHDIPVAHVEAGLRTHGHEPWPEERTRRAIDSIASWHFAPTKTAKKNLLAEGVDPASVWLVGNPFVDSLSRSGVRREKADVRTVLITIHRRENWKKLQSIAGPIAGLAAAHGDWQFLWPVHPNPEIKHAVGDTCGHLGNVSISEPLPYEQFLQKLAGARLVITDSGGVQEEAAVLGVPTLVVRENTERPETVVAGVSRLVRPWTLFEEAAVLLESPEALNEMEWPAAVFGDGHAGDRIAEILVRGYCQLGELPQ